MEFGNILPKQEHLANLSTQQQNLRKNISILEKKMFIFIYINCQLHLQYIAKDSKHTNTHIHIYIFY